MSTEDTQAVVAHHMEALLAGDMDAVMEDYTDESVFVINLGGAVTGRDAIRPFLEGAGQLADFTETMAVTHGSVHYVTWTAAGVTLGTDTLVVHDGKIAVQTVTVVLAD